MKERPEGPNIYAPSLEEIWGVKDEKGITIKKGLAARIRDRRIRDVPKKADVGLRIGKTIECPISVGSLEHRVTSIVDYERD